jgi:hypothetical protein
VAEVHDGAFPQPENYFGMKDEEYDELLAQLNGQRPVREETSDVS